MSRYNVLTWDPLLEQYTEQEGMDNPCLNVTISGLRLALRELRSLGYSCHRVRTSSCGSYGSDLSVLVELLDATD